MQNLLEEQHSLSSEDSWGLTFSPYYKDNEHITLIIYV